MTKQYRFGGTVFRIETPSPLREDPRFEAFLDEASPPDVTYTASPITPEQAITTDWPVVTERQGSTINVYMDLALVPDITVAHFLIAAEAAFVLTEKGSFILHASYVYHQGEAILFTAPCQTGKSTQAHYWEQERGSTTVNEDRVILYKENGVYMAGGCWATGSARISKNISAPVKAIILLGQGSENRVTRPRPSEIIPRLLPQCSYDQKNPAAIRNMLDILLDLIQSVNILSYDCIHHPSSVADLEMYL